MHLRNNANDSNPVVDAVGNVGCGPLIEIGVRAHRAGRLELNGCFSTYLVRLRLFRLETCQVDEALMPSRGCQ